MATTALQHTSNASEVNRMAIMTIALGQMRIGQHEQPIIKFQVSTSVQQPLC